ncbi:MAG: sulfatase-like hydrolase/transferase [Phycisphaera sp.]|nr:sulfatase-like hydrolase/transferase [Phycisphaera sp.]
MKHVTRLTIVLMLAGLCTAPLLAADVPTKRKPNVIFVMTDDQGYKDVHALGHPYIITPNLDRLWAQSVRALDYHVRPTCSPTRAAIMSGRAPMRSGIWHTIMGRSLMRGEEVTLAETFKAGGYVTGMFGKWHLGDNYPMRPQDQGFDVVVQHKGGGVTQGPDYYGNDYFDDHYIRNGEAEPFTGFCTDIWFDEAMKFAEANRDRPFFAYLATNAPHHPWNVAPEYEKPYLDMGVAKTASPYYALITNIDDNMGRLMQRLDELGLADNTILIFTSDNGPAGGWPLHGDKNTKPLPNFTADMTGAKGSCYEGGHRVPLFVRWPAGGLGGEGKGRDFGQVVADIDILPTLADLCGVTRPDGPPLDGVSFAPALHGDAQPILNERYHVIQSQRHPMPEKDTRTVVLRGTWRLVLNMKDKGSVELFDVSNDRRESDDVADRYPERVRDMLAAYDRWWDSQKPMFTRYSRIALGAPQEPVTRLMSHDWLTTEINDCVWHQDGVKNGQMGNGPWAVNVERPGRYTFELRRWPSEHPGPIEADRVRLKVGDVEAVVDCDPTAESVSITLDLQSGPAMVQSWLRIPNRKNAERGAYYVYISRVND